MDSFQNHHQQHDHQILGQTLAGATTAGGDRPWFPSPTPPPPPPPAGSYYYHHQNPPPQFQQHQHHHHHHPMAPPPPPPHPHAPPSPYHGTPLPYPHHSQYPHPAFPPRPQPSISPLQHCPPPPPPNQAWGNPSWVQHQGWEYPDRNVPFSNEEDWAARAKAWAATQPGTENHHAQTQFIPVGRIDDRNHAYHDEYQQAVGHRDVNQPSFPQLSNHHFQAGTMDPLKQVNHLNGSTFNSGPSSYGTGYNAGDEAIRVNVDHTNSPQKSYLSSLSVYDQEVSYSYSSAPGNREAIHHSEGSHVPLPLPVSSAPEGHLSQSMLPVQIISTEQPCFSNHGLPASFLPDASDRPLDFERKHDTDRESHHKINYGHAGPTGAVGVMDHDPTVSSVHTWPLSAAPGVDFPQIPLGPSGTQFDPTFIPQSSLPVQPSPVFGGMPAPTFRPSVPPLSAPYGLGPGAAPFSGELNVALNLSERPKKAAVPNWLREEIIKNKSVIPGAASTQPIGNSFDSIGPGDGDKSVGRGDQSDSRSIDSTRSIEDEEDDEEDVEAARSAAINQEIKRVLTEVLLKVTDELFDEIATKVLNEDEQTVGVVEETVNNGNQTVSPPVTIPTNKATTKILIPRKLESNVINRSDESSDTSSPRGNILGLANYASEDDDDETHSSNLLSSVKDGSALHQGESNDIPSENENKFVKDEANIEGAAEKHGVKLREENHMMGNGSPLIDNLSCPDKASEGVSAVCEESIPVVNAKIKELHSENEISLKSNDVATKDDSRQEYKHGKSDKTLAKGRESRKAVHSNKSSKNRDDGKVSLERTSHETSDASDSIIQEGRSKVKEKMDERDRLKERADDKSSERGSNVKESSSRRSSKQNIIKDDRKEITQDKRDNKEDGERKREQGRDEKEDWHGRPTKDSSRYSSGRSPMPSGRGKNFKDYSFSHGSASGDEPSDNSKKRKKSSDARNLSPSPTKSRKRQVSRSPHSKHSHRRHSPYSSTDRRRRLRSISPRCKRSFAHKRCS